MNFIRLGDHSSHGGTMITATGFPYLDGLPVCVEGDLHWCPEHGHGIRVVHATTLLIAIDGRRIIRHGDRAECGAIIYATQPWVTSD